MEPIQWSLALGMRVAMYRGVIKESEAMGRKQTFLVIRYILILSTGLLAFIESTAGASLIPLGVLVATALGSNVVLGQASPFSFFDASFQAPVLISDTAMISLSLLLTRANQESFLFFFFVLSWPQSSRTLVTLAICAGLIGLASFWWSVTCPTAGHRLHSCGYHSCSRPRYSLATSCFGAYR